MTSRGDLVNSNDYVAQEFLESESMVVDQQSCHCSNEVTSLFNLYAKSILKEINSTNGVSIIHLCEYERKCLGIIEERLFDALHIDATCGFEICQRFWGLHDVIITMNKRKFSAKCENELRIAFGDEILSRICEYNSRECDNNSEFKSQWSQATKSYLGKIGCDENGEEEKTCLFFCDIALACLSSTQYRYEERIASTERLCVSLENERNILEGKVHSAKIDAQSNKSISEVLETRLVDSVKLNQMQAKTIRNLKTENEKLQQINKALMEGMENSSRNAEPNSTCKDCKCVELENKLEEANFLISTLNSAALLKEESIAHDAARIEKLECELSDTRVKLAEHSSMSEELLLSALVERENCVKDRYANEIQTLISKCSDLKTSVEFYRSRLDSQYDLPLSQVDISHSDHHSQDDLVDMKMQSAKKIASLEGELAESRKQYTSYMEFFLSQVGSLQQELSVATEEIVESKNKFDISQIEIKKLLGDKENLERDCLLLSQRLETMDDHVNQLTSNAVRVEEEYKHKIREISSFLTEAQNNIDSLSNENNTMLEEMAALTEAFDRRGDRLQELELNLRRAVDDLAAAGRDKEFASTTMEELSITASEEIQIRDSEISKLAQDVQHYCSIAEKMQAQFLDVDSAYNRLRLDIAALNVKHQEELESARLQSLEELSSVRGQYLALVTEHSNLCEAFIEAQSELRQFKGAIRE